MYLMRNDWGRECLKTYHRIVPKSEPIEDWEKRIELNALCVIALFRSFISLHAIPRNQFGNDKQEKRD